MADQQSRGGKKQGAGAENPERHQGVHPDTNSNNPVDQTAREIERRQQNEDDPSRAPESGDLD